MSNEKKFVAVLIDSDNARPSKLGPVMEEAVKFGRTTIRRAYGDWTTQSMGGWKKLLHEHAIHPVQQFRNTVGKNATDSAMIIDIMDILHREHIDVFCLISSDSDFTRLATRLRESGKIVIGIGEKKTPKSFQNACNRFIFTENLTSPEEEARARAKVTKRKTTKRTTKKTTKTKELPHEPEPLPILRKAFDIASGEEELILLSELGSALRSLDPSFDPRSYGEKKMVDLIKSFPNVFELKTKKDQPFTFYIMKA